MDIETFPTGYHNGWTQAVDEARGILVHPDVKRAIAQIVDRHYEVVSNIYLQDTCNYCDTILQEGTSISNHVADKVSQYLLTLIT